MSLFPKALRRFRFKEIETMQSGCSASRPLNDVVAERLARKDTTAELEAYLLNPREASSSTSAALGQDAQAQAQSRRLADTEARLADSEAREHRATEQLRDTIAEADSLRRECDQQREEAHNVQMELDKISTEANGKIEAANDRIRTLRSRRDEAEQELQTLKASTLPLYQEEKNKMEAENRQLSEQKEALLRIVEDLHQTCIAAGLNTAGRQSIDNITCTITQDFRLS